MLVHRAAPRPGVTEEVEGEPAAWRINLREVAQVATVALFMIAFWAVLEYARVLLLPIVSGIVIGLMLGPVTVIAARYRIPSWLTAAVLIALVLVLFNLFVVVLTAPLIEWVGKAPAIGETIRQKFIFLERPIAALRDLYKTVVQSGSTPLKVDTGGEIGMIAPVVTAVAPVIGEVLLFFGTLFFVLGGRAELRRQIINLFGRRETRLRTLRIWNDIESNLTTYLSTMALIYLAVGTTTGLMTWLLGYPSPLVWGLVAFILNFIPYLGPAVVVVVLAAVGLVSFPTLGYALVGPALYVALTTLEGHFVTPAIIGRRMTINPFLVFLALAFWTWLWGAVGAFLAMPLLIASLVALNHLFPKDEIKLPA